MLCCKGCEKWWHSCCVNMKGITKESAENIKDWKCPFCYVSRFTPVAFIKAAFPEFFVSGSVQTDTETILLIVSL